MSEETESTNQSKEGAMRKAISAAVVFCILDLSGIGHATALAEEPGRSATRKWEYRIVPKDQLPGTRSKDLTTALNKLGDEGWELVAAEPVYIFKRSNNQSQADDVKRQIDFLQTELDTWKNRVAWSRVMARKGFLSKNELQQEEALLKEVEIALEKANKELKTLAPEPAKMPEKNRTPQK